MRLAYDAVLSETLGIRGNWGQFVHDEAACFPMPSSNHVVLRTTLLRASEIGFRKALLQSLDTTAKPPAETSRKLAQMVFCIDVRSERIRRQIESVSGDVETFGFAGFFSRPIAFTSIGETEPDAQLPVLLKSQFEVREGLHTGCSEGQTENEKIHANEGLCRRV